MEYKPYPPMANTSFEAICKKWIEAIKRKESATWICPPLSAAYRIIWQFQQDKALQKKLLGTSYSKYFFVHVDLKQKETITKEDFYSVLKESIQQQTNYLYDFIKDPLEIIDNLISEKTIIFFVEGIDKSIRKKNWEVVDELSFLAQRNWSTHILLFVETDITHLDYFSQFCKRTTLAQNIDVQPRFNPKEGSYFQKYLAHNWKVTVTSQQQKWINDNCGGHFLFIKEAYRKIASNPKVSYDELEQEHTFVLKAKAIFDNFLLDEQAVLEAVAQNKKIDPKLNHSKNNLIRLGWLALKNGTIDITVPIVKKVLQRKDNSSPYSLDQSYMLTVLERKIFQLLKENSNTIVTRETIAKTLWRETWEEKYSDWAIDQLVHKIREKFKKMQIPYKLVTKKGEGFILFN